MIASAYNFIYAAACLMIDLVFWKCFEILNAGQCNFDWFCLVMCMLHQLMFSRERGQSLMDQPSAVSLMTHQHSTERGRSALHLLLHSSLTPWTLLSLTHSIQRNSHTMERIDSVIVNSGFRINFCLFNAKLVLQDGSLGEANGVFSVCKICSYKESSSLLPELSVLLGHVPSYWKLWEAGKQAKGEKPAKGTCDDLHKMQELLAVQYRTGSFLVPACVSGNSSFTYLRMIIVMT